MKKHLLAFLLAVSCFAAPLSAQSVRIPGTTTDAIYSAEVQQGYRLLINLPAGYYQSKKHYPVLYLLDAQWDFPLFSSIYGQQHYDGFAPEMIIVGITWGGEQPDYDKLRRRDFTPTIEAGNPIGGGADKFLNFIEKELIPYTDNRLRTNGTKALAGSSLGGLFTLYTFLNKPQLFDMYLPTSPAVSWDKNWLFNHTRQVKYVPATGKSLFMAVSELENLYQPVIRYGSALQQRYPALRYDFHVVTGAGHSGVKAEGNTRGMQFLFAPLAAGEAQDKH